MKVFIFGNSGSGKSVLVDALSEQFPAQKVRVDEYRMAYGDFTWKGEKHAVDHFIRAIDSRSKDQIIECSGMGKSAERLMWHLPLINDNKILLVVLKCDPVICRDRNRLKVWRELKLPMELEKTIDRHIREYDHTKVLSRFFRYNKIVLDSSDDSQLHHNVTTILANIQ
jgi:ABC-type dipeptide/oligopeptide/nickel transport system ATPase component